MRTFKKISAHTNKNTNAQSCPAALCEFLFSLLRLQVLFTSRNSCAGLRCRPLQLFARCWFFSANLTLSDAFFFCCCCPLCLDSDEVWRNSAEAHHDLPELRPGSLQAHEVSGLAGSSPFRSGKKKFSATGRGCRAVFRRKKNKAKKKTKNCGTSFRVLPGAASPRRRPAYTFSPRRQVASPRTPPPAASITLCTTSIFFL